MELFHLVTHSKECRVHRYGDMGFVCIDSSFFTHMTPDCPLPICVECAKHLATITAERLVFGHKVINLDDAITSAFGTPDKLIKAQERSRENDHKFDADFIRLWR